MVVIPSQNYFAGLFAVFFRENSVTFPLTGCMSYFGILGAFFRDYSSIIAAVSHAPRRTFFRIVRDRGGRASRGE